MGGKSSKKVALADVDPMILYTTRLTEAMLAGEMTTVKLLSGNDGENSAEVKALAAETPEFSQQQAVGLNEKAFFRGSCAYIHLAVCCHPSAVEYFIDQKADLSERLTGRLIAGDPTSVYKRESIADFYRDQLYYTSATPPRAAVGYYDHCDLRPFIITEEKDFTLLQLAIIFAADQYVEGIVRLLLEHKEVVTTVNSITPVHQMSALMFAVKRDNMTLVRLLLEHEANIYLEDSNGYAALDFDETGDVKSLEQAFKAKLVLHTLTGMTPNVPNVIVHIILDYVGFAEEHAEFVYQLHASSNEDSDSDTYDYHANADMDANENDENTDNGEEQAA